MLRADSYKTSLSTFSMMASASYFSVHLTEINCSLILMIFSVLTVCQGVTQPYQVINEITTEYQLPDLPFDYGDLEPYVDLETVRVHHLGHHAGYTRKLNAALQLWRGEVSLLTFKFWC